MTHSLLKPKGKAPHAFLIALAAAFLLFLPFLIIDGGYFIYYGDFNVQQIPFYRMAHDSVRSGNIFWSWTTDLGANFIGSYSFYLLGSPFFWLTLPFPSAAVPYLMGPLLMLKFACSSVAAYAYLQRFVRPDYAVIGGLLYAFSGFSIYNVFFNHFHEAIIYFPLMLLGMELYMKDNRRGVFALTVFLSALSNYYFFIGQAIFLIIYWLVRFFSGAWDCTLSKFLWLVFEALAGTAGAALILLPSYYAVSQNPRTESVLAGWDFLIYTKPQRLYDILHSFFFPQDIPARPNFFPDSDNKWSSMSAWLPVFGCCGAIAYFQSRRHTDWLRRMLTICFFCAVIPGFNAMFQLFNWAYYARWYYMLVLMLVTATVLCFEQAEERPVEWKRAFGWTFGITAFFALFIGFMPKSWKPAEDSGKIKFGLMEHADRFWIFVAIAVVSLLLAGLLVLLFKSERRLFYRWAVSVIFCVSLIYGWYLLGLGKANSNYLSSFVAEEGIEGKDKVELPDGEETVRVDVQKGMDNQAMFWQLPTIQAFHSIVPGSVMEFYPTIGVERSVGSRPEASHYALRSFLSTRWLFDSIERSDWDKENAFEYNGVAKMPGWKKVGEQNNFNLYENEYYVPMGFTYDYYITRSEYDDLSQTQRELSLLKAIVLPDETAEQVRSTLRPLSEKESVAYSQAAYFTDCEERRAAAASTFTRDNLGFSAAIRLEKENLVFFSVPYEDGWSATVNGQPVDIIKANVGFMAVACPAGEEVNIRFNYMTPGLQPGLLISGGALLLFILYMVLMVRFDKRMQRRLDRLEGQAPSFTGAADVLPADDAAPVGLPDDGEPSLPTADSPVVLPPSGTAPEETFDLYSLYPGAEDPEAPEPPEKGPDIGTQNPE